MTITEGDFFDYKEKKEKYFPDFDLLEYYNKDLNRLSTTQNDLFSFSNPALQLYKFPVFKNIKFPSGEYNFYYYKLSFIIKNCKYQIKSPAESVKYLKSCLLEFDRLFADGHEYVAQIIPPNDGTPNNGYDYDAVSGYYNYQATSDDGDFLQFTKKIQKEVTYYEEIKEMNNDFEKPQVISNSSNIAIPESIFWTGKNSQLIYLIEALKGKGFLRKVDDTATIISNHFVDEQGQEFKNIAQAWQGVKNNISGKCRGSDDIDECIPN